LEIVSSRNDGIRYIIGVPPADADVMRRTLISYLPGLSIREIPDYLESMLVVEENEDAKQATEKSLGFVQLHFPMTLFYL